jgi:hypothetical protein
LAAKGARYAGTMTNDEIQHDADEAREAQGVPDEGPGSKTAPPSNPEADSDDTEKGKDKLDSIVNW